MNILSIDTTTKIAAVSLKLKNNILIEKRKENEITHSEKLLPLIDETLKDINITLKDIDTYAILNGPGSFTGVRIGLSSIKAFSMVYNKPIFTISALEQLAILGFLKQDNVKEKYILSLIDAKNCRVYYSVYKVYLLNNKVVTEIIVEENNDLIEKVLYNTFNKLKSISSDIIIVGDCVDTFNEVIQQYFKNSKYYNLYPTPTDVIKTMEMISNYKNYIFDTFTLDAHYVRKSQAERIKNEHLTQ